MQIIGCDLHARQQTIAMLDTGSGHPCATGRHVQSCHPARETHYRTLVVNAEGLAKDSAERAEVCDGVASRCVLLFLSGKLGVYRQRGEQSDCSRDQHKQRSAFHVACSAWPGRPSFCKAHRLIIG
jgi:hypothetical protein